MEIVLSDDDDYKIFDDSNVQQWDLRLSVDTGAQLWKLLTITSFVKY